MQIENAYVHIPFCTYKCDFCDFAAFAGLEDRQQEYVDRLIWEIEQRVATTKAAVAPLKTLHFGGGTPGLLPVQMLASIIQTLKSTYGFAKDIEIALESTPQAVSDTVARQWCELGVNRVSIGVESLDDRELQAIGRKQTESQALEAIDLVQAAGMQNISIDFMYGLPEQTLDSFSRTLQKIERIIKAHPGIKHLSAYALELAVSAPLLKTYPSGDARYPQDQDTVSMLYSLIDTMTALGLQHYEVSNFARAGFHSRHNLSYWTRKSYLAYGVGAHRFVDGIRSSNYRSFNKYIRNPLFDETSEIIDPAIALQEAIMLGLRLRSGLSLSQISNDFGYDLKRERAKEIEDMIQEGLLDLSDGCLSITRKGLPLSNCVISSLI